MMGVMSTDNRKSYNNTTYFPEQNMCVRPQMKRSAVTNRPNHQRYKSYIPKQLEPKRPKTRGFGNQPNLNSYRDYSLEN